MPPEGAGGTEPRTWTIWVCDADGCDLLIEDQHTCRRDGCPRRREPGLYSHEVRVVEQQPPTEDAIALSEKATALAERYGDALVRISDVLANTEPRGHLNRIRAILAGLDLPPGPPEPTQGNDPCPACAQPGGAHSPTCPIFKGRDLASGDEWDPAAVDAVVELADSPGFVLDGEGVQQNEDPDGKALAEILAGRGWPPRSGHHLRRLERKLAAALELLRFKGAARDTGGRSG